VAVNFKSPYFALWMLSVFVVSFGIMWRQRTTELPAPESPPAALVADRERQPPVSAAASPPWAGDRPTPAAYPTATVQRVRAEARADVGAEGTRNQLQPMPVSIQVWNRANKHRIDGTVQNLGPSTMTVTARVENSTTHAISEFDLVIEPQETKRFSSETGLEIHANDQITFTSLPYADQTQIVPP
jgi:hypothetical protein